MSNPFDAVARIGRRRKPRASGLTMMIDLGVPLTVQRDLLTMAGTYVDFAKIAIGTSCLLDEAYLRDKIEGYAAAEVNAFPGGMLLEYAVAHGTVEPFLEACQKVGYGWVEVSDNYLDIGAADKAALIEQVRRSGLQVLAEVGRKEEETSVTSIAEQVAACLDCGAALVLVEAAELEGEGRRGAVLDALRQVPLEHVMFELPGRWIPGTGFGDPARAMRSLLDALGSEVNVANVVPEDVLFLENFRRRLSTNLDLGQG